MAEKGESTGEELTAEHTGHAALGGHDVRAVALVYRHVFGARARGREHGRGRSNTCNMMLLTDAVSDVISCDVVRCPRPSVQPRSRTTLQHHTQRKTPTHQT